MRKRMPKTLEDMQKDVARVLADTRITHFEVGESVWYNVPLRRWYRNGPNGPELLEPQLPHPWPEEANG